MSNNNVTSSGSNDFVGLSSDLWWLWPILSCVIFIFIVTLTIKRVPQYDHIIGVITQHHGISATGRADIKILLPMEFVDRRPGDPIVADCSGEKFLGLVGPDQAQLISKNQLSDLLGASKRVKSLADQNVRSQNAEIETSATLPAIGDLCRITIEIGRKRLWQVLLGPYL